MNLLQRQKGMSTGGMLLTILAVLFAATVVMKLFPVYMDNFTVKSILESLDRQPGITKASTRNVKSSISKGFQTNMVRDISLDDVVVKKENGHLVVDINYERRVDLISNIDVVITFENNWTIKHQ